MERDGRIDQNEAVTATPQMAGVPITLDEFLRLAARYHLGGLTLSDGELSYLLSGLKERAALELDLGDGRKFESVRVERKLDGSVSVFFGF